MNEHQQESAYFLVRGSSNRDEALVDANRNVFKSKNVAAKTHKRRLVETRSNDFFLQSQSHVQSTPASPKHSVCHSWGSDILLSGTAQTNTTALTPR